MQQVSQNHTVRVSVNVKNVHLLVRFPCRLSFQLRTENSMSQSVNTYELKKGECQFNQTVHIDVDVNYDIQKRSYEQKNIKIVIIMSSANGMIPAGSILFNPCVSDSLQRQEQLMNLDKCPDRSATIKFTYWYQYLRKANYSAVSQSNYLESRSGFKNTKTQLRQSTYSNMNAELNYQQQNQQHQISVENYGKSSKFSSPPPRDITPTRLGRASTILSPTRIKTDIAQNIHSSSINYNGTFSNNAQQLYVQEPRLGQSLYPINHSTVVRNGKQILPTIMQSQINANQSSLQISQKAVYLKQIARLKGQLKSIQNQDKWQQLHKVKDQNESLLRQLELNKEKYRNLQKKDREYNLTIKQLKDEIQRLRVKLANIQITKSDLEYNLNDKDKRWKQTQLEVKRLQEKISDMNIKLTSNQKKFQFKELSLQEQLKKLTQKYSQSEMQIQRVTFQYNNILSQMQEQQKRYQLNIKEKERYFNEQKNKLNKRLEILSYQYEKIKEELSQKQHSCNSEILNNKMLNKRLNERENRLVELENQLEFVNAKLRKEEEHRKSLENQNKLLKLVEQERNILKKKYNDLISESAKVKEKFTITESQNITLSGKTKEQQSQLNDLKKQKATLNSKVNILTKQIQDLQKLNQRKARQQDLLSAQHMNTSQRMNDLRSKLQAEQRDYNDIITQYEDQIAYISKAKQYSDTEIEDLKWQLQTQKQRSLQISTKLKQMTSQVLLLNKNLLQSEDKIKQLNEQIEQLHSQSKHLTNEKLILEQKQRQLNQIIKTKTNQNYQLSKRKLQSEQEIYLLKQKLDHAVNYQKDKQLSDEKMIKQKQKEIRELHQENTKIQLEMLHYREDINKLNQQKSSKTSQIVHLKNNSQLLQQRINDLQVKNEHLRQEIKNSNFELNNTKQQRDGVRGQFDKLTKSYEKLTNQWKQYRNNTTNALEQLITQMAKDQNTNEQQIKLLIFPDMNISSMQVEAIKKRNLIVSSYREKISGFEKQLDVSKITIEKLKIKIQEKQAEIQFVLSKQKQKLKATVAEHVQELSSLTEQMRKGEDRNIFLIGQNQKLINQLKKSQDIISQQKSQIQQQIAGKQNLKLQIKNLEEKILNLKTHQINIKTQGQAKLIQFNEQSENQMLRLKATLQQYERKFITYDKNLLQKQESIKKLQKQLSGVIYERDKHEQKSHQLNQKVNNITEEKKIIEKKLKSTQKQLKQQSQLNQQINQTLNNEKMKLEQTKIKYNQTFQLLTDIQISNQKLKQQLESSISNIKTLEQNVKEKQQKSKSTSERLHKQVKQLNQQIITLSSELQLNAFIIKQHQQLISNNKNQLISAKQEINKKKQEIIRLEQQLQSKKNKMIYMDESLISNRTEKGDLLEENQRYRSKILELENQLREMKIVEEELQQRQEELNKMRVEYDSNIKSYEKTITEMKTSSNIHISLNTQRNNTHNLNKLSSSRMTPYRQDDSRRKIKQLQQLLELKHVDLAGERKKWIYETEREKRMLVQQINQLMRQIQNMQSEFDFQRIQLNKQNEQLTEQVAQLIRIIEEKQQVMFAVENIAKDNQNNEKSRVTELKNNIEQLKKNIKGRISEQSFERVKRLQQSRESFHSKSRFSQPEQFNKNLNSLQNQQAVHLHEHFHHYFSLQGKYNNEVEQSVQQVNKNHPQMKTSIIYHHEQVTRSGNGEQRQIKNN